MEYTDKEHVKPLNGKKFSEDTFSVQNLTSQEKKEVILDISYAAVPNIVSSIGTLLKDSISLLFIGHLNNDLLFAALGFGLTWAMAFSTAIVNGFAAGFGTLASQAYGAGNHRKFGLLYQKILVISTMVLGCLAVFLWFTEAELNFMGFHTDLAGEVGTFIRCLTLDFFLVMFYEVTRFYLVSQNCFYVPAAISCFTTTLHVFWCYLFINHLEMGLVGMAIARTITDAASAAIIYYYCRYHNPCPASWFEWKPECLEGLKEFLKDIASHGSSVYAEWIAFEISTIIIGFLGNNAVLGAHAATLNYIYLNFNVTFGFTLAMSVFIGNAAGEGNLAKAKKYAYIGLFMCFFLVTFLNCFVFLFKDYIAKFYTTEPNVQSYISLLLGFYIFGMHGDLGTNILAYVLRTLGQDRYVLKCYMYTYYGWGVTMSIITALWLGFGFYGVWFALVSGFWIMLSLNVYRFYNLNWKEEIYKICHEMKHQDTSASDGTEMDVLC